MSAETVCFDYGQRRYCARVLRKPRKTLSIAVLPEGAIEASAPLAATPQQLRQRLQKRARWIVCQLNYFAQYAPRTPPRQYVGGETHLYLGRKYRLKISAGNAAEVKLRGGYLRAVCRGGAPNLVCGLLWRWYRQRAKQKFAERLQKCLAKFHNMPPPPLAIVRLKKRWGSMTPSGRLTLNLDLIRAPVECIDYVIIHELCHRLHPHHGRQFQQLLAAKVGDWRAIKQKLERRLS